jgi:hypothetical protein
MTDTTQKRLPVALLGLRLTLALVFAVWSLDKFVNPDHGAAVFQAFYGLQTVPPTLVYAAGVVQAVLVAAFALGMDLRRGWFHARGNDGGVVEGLSRSGEHPVLLGLADVGGLGRAMAPTR